MLWKILRLKNCVKPSRYLRLAGRDPASCRGLSAKQTSVCPPEGQIHEKGRSH